MSTIASPQPIVRLTLTRTDTDAETGRSRRRRACPCPAPSSSPLPTRAAPRWRTASRRRPRRWLSLPMARCTSTPASASRAAWRSWRTPRRRPESCHTSTWPPPIASLVSPVREAREGLGGGYGFRARQPFLLASRRRRGIETALKLLSRVFVLPPSPHTPFGAGLETFSIYDGVEREIDRLFRNGCLTSDGASHLAGFGAMLVLDCVINNFDRAPLIWRNQGVTCDVRVTCVL